MSLKSFACFDDVNQRLEEIELHVSLITHAGFDTTSITIHSYDEIRNKAI